MSPHVPRRTLRSCAIAIAAFLCVVLPDVAAIRAPAGASPAVAESAQASGLVVDSPGAGLARELAYQRFKGLGLEPTEATSIIGAVGAHVAMGLVDRDLAARLPEPAALEAGQVARVLARLLAAGPAMGTAEDLVWAFGMEDVFDLGVERGELLDPPSPGGGASSLGSSVGDAGGAAAPVANIGGTCLLCPAVDAGPFTPIFSWQGIDGNILAGGDCAWYSFDVVAGITYEFKTCDPEGFTTFDTNLDIYDPSGGAPCGFLWANDDCFGIGPGSLASWTATLSGVVNVRLRGVPGGPTSPGGDFRLAYRKTCPTSSDCTTPDGVLNTPTTACQYVTDTLDACSESRFYTVDLVHGQTYTFTLCAATCALASADFDSLLEFYQGGILDDDTATCGDDGEIVFSVVTDGTYCIRVASEGGTGDAFSLGYRVACQPPSDLEILPFTSSTNAPDCTKDQRFSITMGGTGDFAVSWTIAAAPGNTATPAAGAFTTSANAATFDSLLQGDGDYVVDVTVTNECGSVSSTLTYTLADQAGPSMVAIAEGAPCLPGPAPLRTDLLRRRVPLPSDADQPLDVADPVAPRRPPGASMEPGNGLPAPTPGGRRSLDLDVVRENLYSSADPREVEANLARKLGVAAKSIRVVDSRDPRFFRPPEAAAVSCPSPCTVGTLSQLTNDYYEVFLSCSNGAFTARTGRQHPVTLSSGTAQNVIFGGAGGSPGTSDVTFHVFETNDNFIDPTGGRTCLFVPPMSPVEPAAAGIESEWTRALSNGTALTMREEIVAFGDTVNNSGIRLTLGATNNSGPPVTMGVRWQIDYQNASDDGPHYAQVHCTPFEIFNSRSTEHEFTPAEIDDQDFYRIQNNTGSPIFGNFSGTAELGGFPDTGKPDRLIYGHWGRMTGSGWNFVTVEGDTGPDSDSAVLYYFGYTPAAGIPIAAGETFSRSVIVFTAGDATDCGSFRPGNCEPAMVTICPGTCARIGATATDNCGPATVSLIDSTFGAPTCGSYPCTVEFPDPGTFVYTWEARDDAGNRQICTSTVVVEDTGSCNLPPTCDAGGPYASTCREAPVEGAGVDDPDDDAITYAWTSDRPDVTVSPAGGIVPGGAGSRGIPPSVATLDPGTPACGVVANLTLTVDDGRGGRSSCTTTVTFSDTDPPIVDSASGPIACLWPPNHWYVAFSTADLRVNAIDTCSEPVTWRLLGCSSDQPDDARESDPTSEWNGDGHTVDDCIVSPDGSTIYVRSERCGTGPTAQDGRHYSLLVVARDACGNEGVPVAAGTIHVPHDQSPHERGCRNPTQEGKLDLD